jgi:hypothetical protein
MVWNYEQSLQKGCHIHASISHFSPLFIQQNTRDIFTSNHMAEFDTLGNSMHKSIDAIINSLYQSVLYFTFTNQLFNSRFRVASNMYIQIIINGSFDKFC